MDAVLFKIQLIKQGRPAISVAHEMGVDASTLSRWVRGWNKPCPKLRRKLARLLQVDEAKLFPEGRASDASQQ